MSQRLVAGLGTLRRLLMELPPEDREGCLDQLLGLAEPPADGPSLPRGCVPYLPCPVDALVDTAEGAALRASDHVVDIGAGIGRAAVALHLLSGARLTGVEIQPELALQFDLLVSRLRLEKVKLLRGDANERLSELPDATVLFLYCPFSGARLERLLANARLLYAGRTIRVVTVNLPPLQRDWLERVHETANDVVVYESRGQAQP